MQGFVGVMDSGVGGLSVLAHLVRRAPDRNYLYFADHAFCPYGTKTFAEIKARVLTVADYLKRHNATSIVVACNTASIFAEDIRQSTNLPIYDVIVPTCKIAVRATRNRRVALLATNATVKSQAYQNALAEQGVTVIAYPCSCFVPLVENGATKSEIEKTVAVTLADLPRANCDTIILGCTHFPFLRKKIAPFCNGANIIECQTDFPSGPSMPHGLSGQIVYCTTGDPARANAVAQWCGNVNFTHVDV